MLVNKNMVMLITGSRRGVGRATAFAAAKKGVHLLLVQRKQDLELEKALINEGASSVKTFICDLSDVHQTESLLSDLKNHQIDILFNNAGLLTGGLLQNQKFSDIHQMLEVNVRALIQITHGLLPQMLKRPRAVIVNHASVSSYMRFSGASTYAAAKAAVLAFTECLQNELQGKSVHAMALITPGIKTEMFDQIEVLYKGVAQIPEANYTAEQYAGMIINAIENEQEYLWPKGAVAIGLFLARHFPKLSRRLFSSPAAPQ